jgi:gamma-glutamyltranspeptidase/glutathione hydrolase
LYPSFIHRPIIMSKNGLVAAGHHLASLAGIDILMRGGNAFDSAIATSAVLSVVRPHMTGLGGDAFALLFNAQSGSAEALNASGPAPKDASRQFFLDKGLTRIPLHGIHSVSVPGIVGCWGEISEKYGTISLQELLKSAIQYARQGFPVYPSLSSAIKEAAGKLANDPSAKEIFLRNGRAPLPGEILLQGDLARTLDMIATKGTQSFYHGDIAKLIAEHSQKQSGLLTEDDLADYQSVSKPPIRTSYRGYTVLEQPPVSQGLILLEELNLVEGFDLAELGHNTADSIHVMVEAKKLAFADRLGYLGDPDFVKVPMETLLSKEYAAKRRALIDLDRARATTAKAGIDRMEGDTTYFAIVDRDGNAASFIQSVFSSFGSGVVVEGTGVVLNNRMSAFSLKSDHPNRLDPKKKTTHTLNTYMIMRDDSLFMVGGTPGVDDQVQTNLQVIANILDYQMNVQEAIEAPRWSSRPGTMPGEENQPYELLIEDRILPRVRDDLVKKGHNVKVRDGWSFAGAQAIVLDQSNKVLMGGADPRRDGYAIGW